MTTRIETPQLSPRGAEAGKGLVHVLRSKQFEGGCQIAIANRLTLKSRKLRFKLPDGYVLDGRAREALQMSERMPQFLKRVLAIIGRFVYHSHRWLIVYSPTGGPPAADRVGHITYRVATSADLDRLEELERYGRGATQRHYVEKDNDWLFLACHGDRIVGTRRGSRVIRDSVISRVIQLGPDQYWGADVFCLPEYRDQGIARHLQAFGDRYCGSLGYRDRLGTISATNTASINMNRATGTQPLYYVAHTRILFWEFLRVTKDIPKRVWERRCHEVVSEST